MDLSISSASYRHRRALAAAFAAYFASFFVQGGWNIALPKLAADLDGLPYYSWAVAIPALGMAIVTLMFGKLSDLYGRRIILLMAVGLIILGALIGAVSPTFPMVIGALTILSMGQGAIQPLSFAVLGDLYAPLERGKWAGLLNISSGLAAVIVPTLSGWLVDNFSWRDLFWIDIPIAAAAGVIVWICLPRLAKGNRHQIDLRGLALLSLATSCMIVGFSWAGNTFSWLSPQIVGILGFSALAWILFLRVEACAPEPMLDLHVLTNRTFLTASLAALLSLFGMTAIMVYLPLFLQGVQGASATMSGRVLTPLSFLLSFMGIPAGLLIARTERYKWMYVAGYALIAVVLFGTLSLKADTAVAWGFVITSVIGLGLGAIPTINALVVQYAIPKRLLGVATAGLYFFVMMGRSIAPAILGSILNKRYSALLAPVLSGPLGQLMNPAVRALLNDPRLLLSPTSQAELLDWLRSSSDQSQIVFDQILHAVRSALEGGLRVVFLVGALAMVVSFLLILTIPEIALDEAQ